MKWRRLNGQKMELPIKEVVKRTIIEEHKKGNRLKVCIGSDSLDRAGMVEFATVIVFLREKKGGFMYISNDKVRQKMSIKERMIQEVYKSIEIAYALVICLMNIMSNLRCMQILIQILILNRMSP